MVKEDVLARAHNLGYAMETVERWIKYFGVEQTQRIINANEEVLPHTIRVNTLKVETDALVSKLVSKGWIIRSPGWSESVHALDVLHSPVPVGASVEYLQGKFAIQGVPSQSAVFALGLDGSVPLVADLAAAPGGKTTYIAQLMENCGTILAIERQKRRIRALLSNIERLGVQNVVCIQGDASKFDLHPEFDRILLDAPCTGSGIIRRDKTRRYSRSETDVLKMAHIQRRLLSNAVRSLSSGGRLVYCTCSLEPEENELLVASVLRSHPELALVDPGFGDHWHPGLTDSVGLPGDFMKTKRVFPFDGREGFFVAVLCNE